jgi:hypothetical protein
LRLAERFQAASAHQRAGLESGRATTAQSLFIGSLDRFRDVLKRSPHCCRVENDLICYSFKFAGDAVQFFFYEEWRIAFWADSYREKILCERRVYLVLGVKRFAFETMTDVDITRAST